MAPLEAGAECYGVALRLGPRRSRHSFSCSVVEGYKYMHMHMLYIHVQREALARVSAGAMHVQEGAVDMRVQ